MPQITGYHAGTNIASDEFPHECIDVLGDIDSVRDNVLLHLILAHTPFPSHANQMQPLSDDDDKTAMYDDTIHVSVTGTVISVERESSSFWIYSTQYICGEYDQVAVHARMDKNRKWKQPLMPDRNSIITFDGVLDRFERYTPPSTAHDVTCVVVAVDDITFLQPRPEKKTLADEQWVRDKVKNRKRNWKMNEGDEIASTSNISQTPSMPSTSQTTLGKRKATSSGDNIENPAWL